MVDDKDKVTDDKDKPNTPSAAPFSKETDTAPEVEEEVEDPRKQLFVVKVQHLLAEGKARDAAIPVNDLGDHAHGKAVVYPNKEGVLSQVQINILNDAIEMIEVPVPDGSGIYEDRDPLAAAEAQFPEFTATRHRVTGAVMLRKERPRFAVQVIRPYDREKEIAKAKAKNKG
jgi:hypothetical protein